MAPLRFTSSRQLAMLHLVALSVLALSCAPHVDAVTLAEVHPIACAMSKASPILSNCEPLTLQLYTRVDKGLQCLNNNNRKSHCTTLLTNGNCDVVLCGALDDPGCDVVGAVAQAIITTCNDDTLIGGATDISEFVGPNFALLGKQTVEIINHGGNGLGRRLLSPSQPTFRRGLLARDNQFQVPNTGYTLVVETEQTMNEVLSAPEANALQTDFYNNFNAGGTGRSRITRSTRVGFDSASADVNLYLDLVHHYVSDFTPTEVQQIIQSMNDFRNQQGNPG